MKYFKNHPWVTALAILVADNVIANICSVISYNKSLEKGVELVKDNSEIEE